jgi:hypothetical protein
MLVHILTMFRVEEEEDENLVEVEAGNLREMLEKLGPSPSILPTLHNLIPNIRDKVCMREMLEKLGNSPSILPTLHNLIPSIRHKVCIREMLEKLGPSPSILPTLPNLIPTPGTRYS